MVSLPVTNRLRDFFVFFLAPAKDALNVMGIGNANDRERILSEKWLGKNTEK